MDSWKILEKNIGKGVKIVQYRKKTPLEKILSIGEMIEIRERLEKEKVGIPHFTKSQRKKMKKDAINYFNSLEKEYGRL